MVIISIRVKSLKVSNIYCMSISGQSKALVLHITVY
jgi:hypothetical protein